MGNLRKLISIILTLGMLMLAATTAPWQKEPVYAAGANSESSALSVDPVGRKEGYSAVLYNNTNGLPTSEANDIVETSDGFIWIGSYAGLIRYDGNTFERMFYKDGISSIKSLFVDSRQRLWIGTNDNGVAVLERGELKKWGKLDGMKSAHTKDITEDSDGNIYIATTSGIMMIDPEDNLSVMEDPEIADADMWAIMQGRDGIIYGTTNSGDLMMLKSGKLLRFISTEENLLGGVGYILPDPDNPGCIYQEAPDLGLYHVDLNDGFKVLKKIDIDPLSYLMYMDYIDGKIWICAGNGIGVLEGESFTLLDNLPMRNNVGHVMTDYLGNLWFTSTRQGVMKIVPNRFSDIFARFDLQGTVVNSTCMSEGKLFVGTDTGLLVLGPTGPMSKVPLAKAQTALGVSLQTDDLISLLDGCRIRSIIRDSRDRLWISTWRTNGLICYDHGEVTEYNKEEGLLTDDLRAVYEKEDGSILVVLTGGANVIKDGKVVEAYTEEDGITNTESLTICEGLNGETVIGSNGGGIYVFGKDGMRVIDIEQGLPSDIVMRLKPDKKRNVIWIVTSSAIAYMTPDYQVTTIKEFPYTNNFDLYENSKGDMWVLSSNGIYVVPADELIANGEINTVYYSISNGLPCITTANSYSELTAEGDLYIAGSTGVGKVNIDESFENVNDLKATVPFVEVDGQTIYPDGSGEFTIPSSARKITIHSFVFNYSLNNPQVSCKLDGFDSKSTTVNRSEMVPVDYTNLPGGTYTYTMQLRDSMGRGNKEVTVRIIKEKKLYERTWFMIIAGLLILLAIEEIIRFFVRRNMRKLEERNRETMRQNQILQESEKKLKAQMDIISSIASVYNSMYEIDLEHNSYKELKGGYVSDNDIVVSEEVDIQQIIDQMIRATIDASCINQELLDELRMSDIDENMRDTDIWTREVMNPSKQWRRGRIIVSNRDVDGHIRKILWVSEDIDKEKKDRERLIDMSERAMAASEAKSSFLSNMSHEIRTPINAVLGMNEMILRESSEDSVIEYAQSVRTAGNTLLGIINDILDFSKIEAGKMEILPVEYDLSSVINDLVNMIQTRVEDKGLLLKLEISEDVPKLLYGDEVRIKQVITNILTNAAKYTEKGNVTFCVDFEKTEKEDQIALKVAVKDTGIGIKPEDMAKLFSKFDRIEEERNRHVEGTGLGMSITKKLLEMMGSSLEVESVYGEGSVFSFRLMQRVVKWEPLGDYEAAYRAALSERTKYKEKFTAPEALVLVVDDTPMNLTVFKSLLKMTKVQIETSERGEDAIRLAAEKKYDILFLDHMMPDKDGIETLHEMRDLSGSPNSDTPAICLTANAISGAREKYLAAGFDDYLTKPIDAEKLEEMLIHYLPEDKVKISSGEDVYEEPQEDAKEALPDWIQSCEALDPKEGIKYCGGTEEFLTVLTSFYSEIRRKADRIEELYRAEDLRNYTVEVHALKSSARIIGAGELSEKARLLEDAGKEENTGYIRENTDELLRQYRSYVDILSPIAADDDDLPEIPPEVLSDAYAGLAEFAGDMDYELARMVMQSVKEYKLPPEDKKRFDEISEKLSQLDWDGIKSILQGI